MGVTLYMSGKAKKLRTLPQIIEGQTKSAIRRGLNRLRKNVGDEFRQRGIGRAMFGENLTGAGMKTILARERVVKTGEVYSVGLRIKGVAALVQAGRASKAHRIGSAGKLLIGPGFAARGVVQHPGSRFQQDDFAGRAAAKTQGAFKVELAKGMARVAELVNRG